MTKLEMELDYEKVQTKRKMLECQVTKRKQGRSWMDIKPKCSKCEKRFLCLLMKAKVFKLTEDKTSWIVYEIFAETEDEAMELYYDYAGDDDGIVKEMKSDGEGDVNIEEWNDDNL